MNNILIMMWFTFREALARKVFIFFLAISAIALIIMLAVFSSSSTVEIMTGMKNSGMNQSMQEIVSRLELILISPLTGLCILLSIFASASFVPVMLEKGNIDLLLSKPVSREQLLIGKYMGGLLVVFLNIVFLVIGVWLIMSFKFSYWNLSFLWVAVLITYSFAALYSIIVLIGVLTKGSALGMMLAYIIYLILSPILNFANSNLFLLSTSEVVKWIVRVLYYIIPQTSEVSGSITNSLVLGNPVENYNPLWISFIFIVLTMGIAISLFRKKDF